MAHGERAAWKANRRKEFWSRRYGRRGVPRERVAKLLTHRKERRESAHIVREEVLRYFIDE